MGFGYTTPGRIVELTNLARLRRNAASQRSSAFGASIYYDLMTQERIVYNASPQVSDVQRGVVNYLFKNGSLAAEQRGYTYLALVDPMGGVDPEYPINTGTVYRFWKTPTPSTDVSLLQGFTLTTTTLYVLYPSLTANTWSMNFTFKYDTAPTVNTNTCLFNPSGASGVGIYTYNNSICIRSANTSRSWFTNTDPVADSWASAFHRVLVINNSGYLALYVDGTLQTLRDNSALYTDTTLELGLGGSPYSPNTADWLIGSGTSVNTMKFRLPDHVAYHPTQFKYIALGDNLLDPVILNATIQLTEPDQADSATDQQIRPVLLIKSTLQDEGASGYKYPVLFGLDGMCGSIELTENNTKVVEIGRDGIVAGYRQQDAISENTTLDSRYLNVFYAVRSDYNAVTVKLPTFGRAYPGTWLYFYDVDGHAGTKSFTIDPDNANTGYTINGNTTPQTVISRDWGFMELVYDYYGNTYGNWILIRSFSSDFTYVNTSAANTNLTSPDGPGTVVSVITTAGDRTVRLPQANTCLGKMFIVKKVTSDTNKVIVARATGSVDNFDTADVTSDNLYSMHDGLMAVSDGTVYWSIFRMYKTAEEDQAQLFTNQTLNTAKSVAAVGNSATITMPAAAKHLGRYLMATCYDNTAVTFAANGSETFGTNGPNTFVLRGKNANIVWTTTDSIGTARWHPIGYTNRQTTSVAVNTTIAWPARVVLANATSGNLTMTLPAANSYADMMLSVKKIDNTANTIVLDGNASETIDGANTQTLNTEFQCMTIVSNGTAWSIISLYP